MGLFGLEASRAVSVPYFYEVVTDPAQGGTMEDIIGVLGHRLLAFLLPTLFSDICTTESGQRQLVNVTHAATGARIGTGEQLEGGKKHVFVFR